MDLGTFKIRCQGLNLLHSAVHSEHGIGWTDGTGIYLAPVSVCQGEVENQPHIKLGEFDRGVKSVHWSDDIGNQLCYMCVVHDRNISIWKVEGRQPKLSFKQVRKVNIQPIPQGCLWNPGRDILCVLCPHQSSFYFSHLKNKGSQVLLQTDSETIRCGTWFPDGSKLVICAGTSLMIYSWSDIEKSVTNYAAVPWSIPGVNGYITSIVPVSHDKFLCATELPLESLVKKRDSFVLPDLLNTWSNGPITDGSGDDIIRPSGSEANVRDSLFNIPRTQPETADPSCLVCVGVCETSDLEKVSSCRVKGLLTPDILLYEPSLKVVIVGSNTQSALQVFAFEGSQLTKTAEICLEKDERAKGISCLPKSGCHGNTGVLLVVGKTLQSDHTFPSSSNVSTMKSVLKFFHVKRGSASRMTKAPLAHTQSAPSIPLSVAADDGYTADRLHSGKLDRQMTEGHMDLYAGSHENVSNGNLNGGLGAAPKPPMRRKRSAKKSANAAQKDTNTQQTYTNGGKMLMDYSSESPEMSPRPSGTRNSSAVAPTVQRVTNDDNMCSSVTKSKSEAGSNALNTSAISVESTISKSSLASAISSSSGEESPRDITLNIGGKNTATSKPIITELGDSAINKMPLEVERVDFSSQKQNFQNDFIVEYETPSVLTDYQDQKSKSKQRESVPSGSVPNIPVESLDDIDRILKDQNEKINKLQEQMTSLKRRVDASSCVFPSRYQSQSKPEMMCVAFRCKDGFEVKKTFLLDNGRLQLQQLKQTFSLDMVELYIDDLPCVTGCNIDGYIPMRFEAGTTLYISGKPAVGAI